MYITNIMNLHVALPPDTEIVTIVSLWRNEIEGSMLMITGTARSSSDCSAVASVPSDGELDTGETAPKLKSANKEDKLIHHIYIVITKLVVYELSKLLCRRL